MADPLSAVTSVSGAFKQLGAALIMLEDVVGTGFAPLTQLTQYLERMQREVSTDVAYYLNTMQHMKVEQVDVGEQYLANLLMYKVANILKGLYMSSGCAPP